MRVHLTVLVVMAAAVMLTSAAAAGPDGAKQRVAITARGVFKPTGFGKFVFMPQEPGALESDSGTQTATWSSRKTIRDGQGVEIEVTVETLEGKKGTLVLRGRAEYVDAGYGYTVGASTWKVLRGTGQYARVTGGGRGGGLSVQRRWLGRYEGYLQLP